MMQLLERLPKFALSVIVVLGSLLGWYLYDPPKTLCDIQVESIRGKLNKKFLRGREDGWSYRSGVDKHYEFCMESNSLGGCARFFSRMNYYEKMMRSIPSECRGHASISKFETWFVRAFRIMSMVAWGEGGPAVDSDTPGFLQAREVALYCRLAREHKRLYGEAQHQSIIKALAHKLPKIKEMPGPQWREKTIFGLSCQRYL